MSEMAQSGFGAQVMWNNALIGEVTGDIKLPNYTTTKKDTTSHDNLKGIGSSMVVSVTQGDGSFKINYYGNTVQKAVRTDFIARTKRAMVIIMPMDFAGGGYSYTCYAQISGIDPVISQEGLVTWSITFTPISELLEVTTGAAGLTTPFMAFVDDDSNVLTPAETPAQATYDYNLEAYSDNTAVTITPTAAVGTIRVNGTVVVSGAAADPMTLVGDVTMMIISVSEAGKSPKVYKIRIWKGMNTHP